MSLNAVTFHPPHRTRPTAVSAYIHPNWNCRIEHTTVCLSSNYIVINYRRHEWLLELATRAQVRPVLHSLSSKYCLLILTPCHCRTYVNETFAKCTDANRSAVEAELKDLIFKAFNSDQLWKTDWTKVKLIRYVLFACCWFREVVINIAPVCFTVSCPQRNESESHLIITRGRKRCTDDVNNFDHRAFVPSTPASYGVTHAVQTEESDRREKRAKRFVAEQEAEALARGEGPSGSSLSSRLKGRIVQGGVGSLGGNGGSSYGTPEPEGVYDPVS